MTFTVYFAYWRDGMALFPGFQIENATIFQQIKAVPF